MELQLKICKNVWCMSITPTNIYNRTGWAKAVVWRFMGSVCWRWMRPVDLSVVQRITVLLVRKKRNSDFCGSTFECGRYNVYVELYIHIMSTKNWAWLRARALVYTLQLFINAPLYKNCDKIKQKKMRINEYKIDLIIAQKIYPFCDKLLYLCLWRKFWFFGSCHSNYLFSRFLSSWDTDVLFQFLIRSAIIIVSSHEKLSPLQLLLVIAVILLWASICVCLSFWNRLVFGLFISSSTTMSCTCNSW